MPRGKTDRPVVRGKKSWKYASRDRRMMEGCRTCARWLECVHRCRTSDIETLCVYLIERPERRCWMCVKDGRDCDFECFRWRQSSLEKRPARRELKNAVKGGPGAAVKIRPGEPHIYRSGIKGGGAAAAGIKKIIDG